MDEDRATVEDRMRRFGYSEKEARAAYHLSKAEDLLHDAFVENVESRGGAPGATKMFWLSIYGHHFEALRGFLAKQSAQRAYPEGWGQGISSANETESERDVEARREKMLELNRELEHTNALIDEADDVINGVKEPGENEELHGLSGNYDSMEETRERLLSERELIKEQMARVEKDGPLI